MKHLTFALVALGLLSWTFPILAWLAPSAGNVFSTPHSSPTLLTVSVSVVYGAICLWFAWGIHARLRAAWRLGWIVLAATWLLIAIEVCRTIAIDPQELSIGAKLGVIALIVVLFSLVFWFWGRRWYFHKRYFTQPPTG